MCSVVLVPINSVPGSYLHLRHYYNDLYPPHCRLSCPYGDVQIKDLYKQKESESQSVNVDVLEDSKDTNNLRSKNEPEIILTDSPPKQDSSKSTPPVPMETESITVMASSDPSEVGTANLRTLLSKSGGTKSPYSDISDGSDSEANAPRPRKQVTKGPSETPPSLPAMNGFYPYKPSNKGKESLSNISARLPSFGDVGRPKVTKKDAKKSIQSDEHIPDSQPSSPSRFVAKQQSNSVDEVRTKLLSAYPGSTTAAAMPVSNPEQDQRHSRVDIASIYGVTKTTKGHGDEVPPHSDLHTLSTVAAALLPSNEKPPKHPQMTMLTQEEVNKSDSRVQRSVSPRPASLVPKTTVARRSQSPARFSQQTLEQQAATLPSFDSAPGKRSGDLIHSPSIIVKPGTCEWGGIESSRDEEGHDSDSSGSGSILHIKPSKLAKNGDGTKTEQSVRDETGVSQSYLYCYSSKFPQIFHTLARKQLQLQAVHDFKNRPF